MNRCHRLNRWLTTLQLVACGAIPLLSQSASSAQETSSKSAQQVVSPVVDPSQTTDIASGFSCQEKQDRLSISLAGQPIAEFVFVDDRILRPYFAQLKSRSGVQVTRNHPPQAGVDAMDHDTMHPGLWLAFGDINGVDFWRNRGSIEHMRFVASPQTDNGRFAFATESQLLSSERQQLGLVTQRFTFMDQPTGWLLRWEAIFRTDKQPLIFGDQEEMGCGVRVATAITEQNGGRIVSSTQQVTATATWGQVASWCDYSGNIDGREVGVTLMAAPENFRACWWHNRDYGLMVANPFGRAAMKQGATSQVRLEVGDTLRLSFGAYLHEGSAHDPRQAYDEFTRSSD